MKANFYLAGDPVHDYVIESLYKGCPVEKELRDVRHYEPSEVAVVFGVRKNAVDFSKYRGHVIDEQKRLRQRLIVLETGYIKRGNGKDHYYAAGFNALNGRADFRNQNMPADRWEKLDIELKPWNLKEDGKIILCGQVPWDASVQDIDITRWLVDMVHFIRQQTSRPIIFRPHPLAKMPPIPGVEYSTSQIVNDFRRAFAVITYNSNSAVEAVIEGVPSFSFDQGSMAYRVTNHNVSDIEKPLTPDREQWAYDLAYTQWTPKEMQEGEAWSHLFR